MNASFLRNRQLMNVLGAFVIGVVTTLLVPAVGYALAAGAAVAIIFIYRTIKRDKLKAKAKSDESQKNS